MKYLSPDSIANEQLEEEDYSIKTVVSKTYTEYRSPSGRLHKNYGPAIIGAHHSHYYKNGRMTSTVSFIYGTIVHHYYDGADFKRELHPYELKACIDIAEKMR